MTLVLDAGALIAVDRKDHAIQSLIIKASIAGDRPITSSAVVAQVWRGGPRRAVLAKILKGVRIVSLTPDVGRRLGVLLGRSNTTDVVDAHVASLARQGDVVLTSDARDIDHLLKTRGVVVAVRNV